MASLVQFLAAGVNGAASGTATFVLRGTASSAASVLYNDFEESSQPGTNVITLDANGAAEVYCDAYCDVTLKNSSGSTLRTVTIGHSATCVEVVSDSFTGTDYSGAPTAVSKPITLAAVLDKWYNSAGADDWKVSVAGSGISLSAAFAQFTGLFTNVKSPTYSAAGDGVTDDTNAILAAINDSSGGIVFFPPGTYKFTTLTGSVDDVTLMGTGPSTSILSSSSTSGVLLSFTDNTATKWKRIIGLGITGTGANSNAVMAFEETQNVLLDNVEITCSNYTGSVITRSSGSGKSFITIKDSKFTIGASNTECFKNSASDGDTFWKVDNCKIVVPASFVGNVIEGPDFTVVGCVFDASAVTSGAYNHVSCSSNGTAGKYLGTFTNNTFIDGGSTGYAFALTNAVTGSDFFEDCNKFSGFTEPAAFSDSGQIYNFSLSSSDDLRIYLGSRRGKSLYYSGTAAAGIAVKAMLVAETICIEHTNASNLTVTPNADLLPEGSSYIIRIKNGTAAARDITFGGQEDVTESTVPASGAAVAYYLISPLFDSSSSRGKIVVSTAQSALA